MPTMRLALQVWVLLALAVSATIQTTASKYDHLRTLLDEYTRHGNLDDFCDDFHNDFGGNCRDDLTDEESETFLKLVKTGNKKNIITFMNTRLIEQSSELEMDERECARFHSRTKKMEPTEGVEYLQGKMRDRGYDLTPSTKRSKRLKQTFDDVWSMEACNLAAIGALFGKVTKPKIDTDYYWKQAKGFISKQVENLKDSARSEPEEMSADEKALEEMRSLAEARDKAVKELTVSCVIDRETSACMELYRIQDTSILSRLGVSAVKVSMATPALRDGLYYLATLAESWSLYSFRGTIKNTGAVLFFVFEHIFTILPLAIITMVWFRPEIANIISLSLYGTGLGFIPLIKAIHFLGSESVKRGKGIMLSGSVAYATYAIHLGKITPIQAAAVVYVIVVAYFAITDKEGSAMKILLLISPLIAYTAYQSVDLSEYEIPVFTSTKAINIVPQFGEWITSPRIMPAIALACCLTIMTVCSLCDSVGYATYRDVINHKSGKNRSNEYRPLYPTITQYVTAALNHNSVIILAVSAIPAIVHPMTIFWVFSVFAASTIAAGYIYLASYHDDFIKEGESAGATPDVVIDSMNIIIGMAPKTIILPKFQSFAHLALAVAAGVMGQQLDTFAGVLLAGTVWAITAKRPDKLVLFLGSCCGLIIMLSGSAYHIIAGAIYMIFKLNTKLSFDLTSMNTAVQARDFPSV